MVSCVIWLCCWLSCCSVWMTRLVCVGLMWMRMIGCWYWVCCVLFIGCGVLSICCSFLIGVILMVVICVCLFLMVVV